MLQHFSYYPCLATLYICQLVAYGRLKAKKKFNLSALKLVAVAYERWSLSRGSRHSDLTWKLLVIWKIGRLREEGAHSP